MKKLAVLSLALILGVAALAIAADFAVSGTFTGTRFISTIATGTAPFTVASTTLVTNLHADTADNLGGSTAASLKLKQCEIVVGDPGAASALLVDDNDTPDVCTNAYGVTLTITSVKCFAPVGSPTVTPIINGGAANSILTGALTCTSTAGGASGTLNGTPTMTSGQLVDANITTAGGTAKYLVIYITRTL